MKQESQHWDLFFDRVLTQPPLSYDQVIQKYGYTSPRKASNFLMTAKRQFNRIMEECLGQQSSLALGRDDGQVDEEIKLIRSLLTDSKMIQQIVDSLANSGEEEPGVHSTGEHSIAGEPVLFMDATPNENWDKADTKQMLQHMLHQTADSLLGLNSESSLEKLERPDRQR